MRKILILLMLIVTFGLSSCNVLPGDYHFSQSENNIKAIYITYMPEGLNGALCGVYEMVEVPDKDEFIEELNEIRFYLAGIDLSLETTHPFDEPTMVFLIEYNNGALELVTDSFQVYSTSSTIEELIKLLLDQSVINITFQTCDKEELFELLIKYFPIDEEKFD